MNLMEDSNLVAQLRMFRARKGLSQAAIADKLGIPRATYAYYETTRAKLPARIREQLAEIGFDEEVGKPLFPVAALEVPLPYIGNVAASSEVDWSNPLDSEAFEDVPAQMAGRGRFCCRVASDSCYDLLWPGDLAIFQWTEDKPVGKVVLHRTDDNLVTIKQLRKSLLEFILHPLNPKYQDSVAKGVSVGFLVGIIRRHGSREVTVYDANGIDP